MKENGKHFHEQNSFLYPQFNNELPNQVFVWKGNGNKFDPKLNELLKEDNLKVADEGFYSNPNVMSCENYEVWCRRRIREMLW